MTSRATCSYCVAGVKQAMRYRDWNIQWVVIHIKRKLFSLYYHHIFVSYLREFFFRIIYTFKSCLLSYYLWLCRALFLFFWQWFMPVLYRCVAVSLSRKSFEISAATWTKRKKQIGEKWSWKSESYVVVRTEKGESENIRNLLGPELSTRGELTRIESIIAPFWSERANDGTSNFRACLIHITSKWIFVKNYLWP